MKKPHNSTKQSNETPLRSIRISDETWANIARWSQRRNMTATAWILAAVREKAERENR
jgi:hypothetical protein